MAECETEIRPTETLLGKRGVNNLLHYERKTGIEWFHLRTWKLKGGKAGKRWADASYAQGRKAYHVYC
jgi:hypothetical protein